MKNVRDMNAIFVLCSILFFDMMWWRPFELQILIDFHVCNSRRTKVTKKQDNKENKVVKKVMFEDFSYETSEMPSSPVITSVAMGPNPSMSRGPRDELLLWVLSFNFFNLQGLMKLNRISRTDYVTWSGANPDILLSSKTKALGPNASNRVGSYTPRGHNSDLCKGPQVGLAKGSIYSQMSRNVACN